MALTIQPPFSSSSCFLGANEGPFCRPLWSVPCKHQHWPGPSSTENLAGALRHRIPRRAPRSPRQPGRRRPLTPRPRPAPPLAFPGSTWRRRTRKCRRRRPPGARSRWPGQAEPRARSPAARGPPRAPPAPGRPRPPPRPTPPSGDPPPSGRRSPGEGEEEGEVCEREQGRASRRRFVLPGLGGGAGPAGGRAGRAGGVGRRRRPGRRRQAGGRARLPPPQPLSGQASPARRPRSRRRPGPSPGGHRGTVATRVARVRAEAWTVRPGDVGPCASPEERDPQSSRAPGLPPRGALTSALG
nr:basic salivary proline-rich protein 3-like [Marmota flaviventris]